MLFKLYLEKQQIVACNLLAKLVDFYKLDFLSTIVEKKPGTIDNFLYRHFKQTNHSTSSIFIQHVEKTTYDDNSTKRNRNILRHELELKWTNYYKHHIHLV